MFTWFLPTFIGAWSGASLYLMVEAVQAEPPTDLVTFQWITITALSGVVGVLFWQLLKTRDTNLERMGIYQDNLVRQRDLYHDALIANTEAMRELKHAINDVASLNKMSQRLEELEKRLEKRLGPQ